jgi:hypothetical protein
MLMTMENASTNATDAEDPAVQPGDCESTGHGLGPQPLVIVKRDQPDIVAAVTEHYSGAVVIVDRRVGPRRQTTRPPEAERREGEDPRRPLSRSETSMWNHAHYRIAYRWTDAGE